MSLRYLVVDQNKLRSDRSPEVVEMLAAAPDIHFVLPDAAAIEITKNKWKREDTLRNSLKMLSAYPDRVHVAYNTAECLRTELEVAESSTKVLLFPAGTGALRQILRAVSDSGADRSLYNKVLYEQSHHTNLAQQYFDHRANKQRVGGLIEALKRKLTADTVKQLRAGRLSDDERLAIVSTAAPTLLASTLRSDYAMDPQTIRKLILQKPMLLRYFYLKVWLCVEWLRQGGFESKPDTGITNDLLDHEYVLTALSFDGLITSDTKVKAAYEELRTILANPVIYPLPQTG